ncbi:hypothetical protein C8K30_101472 [Promicromonospora sp. AC04]|nr:hypothetical protein C8K30_101472 [Promicromonospora sp. AC04]
MIVRYIDPSVRVVPAHGKDIILGSLDHLNARELASCTFVVDCDGEVESKWRTREDIVISQHRDLDIDTAVLGGGLRHAVLDYVGPMFESRRESEVFTARLIDFAMGLSGTFGVAADAARSIPDLPLRLSVTDGHRRKIELSDLTSSSRWVSDLSIPSVATIIDELADALSWNKDNITKVHQIAALGESKMCRMHHKTGCDKCMIRRYSGGHTFHSFLASILTLVVGTSISEQEIARSIRVGSSFASEEWDVLKRLHLRGIHIGLKYVDFGTLN